MQNRPKLHTSTAPALTHRRPSVHLQTVRKCLGVGGLLICGLAAMGGGGLEWPRSRQAVLSPVHFQVAGTCLGYDRAFRLEITRERHALILEFMVSYRVTPRIPVPPFGLPPPSSDCDTYRNIDSIFGPPQWREVGGFNGGGFDSGWGEIIKKYQPYRPYVRETHRVFVLRIQGWFSVVLGIGGLIYLLGRSYQSSTRRGGFPVAAER